MKPKRKKYRRSIFVVVYSIAGDKIYYLLLKRKLHWKGWEFPKGGIDLLETKKRAVKREVKEETGIAPIKNKIKRFNVKGKFDYNKEFLDRPGIKGQTYSLYAARIPKRIIIFDKKEHSSYKWSTFNEAVKLLSWPNQKKCLKIVNDWLEEGNIGI